jgi:hypothetical protein
MRTLLVVLIGASLWAVPASASTSVNSGTDTISYNNDASFTEPGPKPGTITMFWNARYYGFPGGYSNIPVCCFDGPPPVEGFYTASLTFDEQPLAAWSQEAGNGWVDCYQTGYGWCGVDAITQVAICDYDCIPMGVNGDTLNRSFIQKITIGDASDPSIGYHYISYRWMLEDYLIKTVLPESALGQQFSWEITYTPFPDPVPEPREWALLLTGFAMLGIGLRTMRRGYSERG